MSRGRVMILTVLLAVAACAPAPPPPAGSPAPSPAAAGAPATSTVRPIPDKLKFTAKTLDDKDFSGESLAGKPAVLWFWAPWCPRCMGQAPHLGRLARANAGKISFVGVGTQDKVPAMKKFVAENEVGGLVHLADVDAAIWTRFGITQQPAYALFYTDGSIEIVKRQMSEIELDDRVAKLTAP